VRDSTLGGREMMKPSWELQMNGFCQIAVTIMAEVQQVPMPAQSGRDHDHVQGEGQDPDPSLLDESPLTAEKNWEPTTQDPSIALKTDIRKTAQITPIEIHIETIIEAVENGALRHIWTETNDGGWVAFPLGDSLPL